MVAITTNRDLAQAHPKDHCSASMRDGTREVSILVDVHNKELRHLINDTILLFDSATVNLNLKITDTIK